MQVEHGASAEVIDAQQLAELAPGLCCDDVSVAAWEPRGGYGDGAIVAGDLLGAAREHGVSYRPNTAVAELIRVGDTITGVRTADGPVHAGTVVLAAGVWSPALLGTACIDLPISTELHHVAVVAHPAGAGAPVAGIDSTTQTYFRPEAAGAMTLIGAFSGRAGVDPDAMPATARAENLADLVGLAAGRVPGLADAGIARGVTGVYDMTPDARPMLGRPDGIAGLVVAAGFSGMGFKISPAVGEALAELIVAGAASRIDLHPFRPGRFADADPITPEYAYSDD